MAVIASATPHDVLNPSTSPAVAGDHLALWTSDRAPTFRTREIFRTPRFAVVQIVETSAENPGAEPTALYWLGVERAGTQISVDALQLVGGGSYDQCGSVDVPATVVSVRAIAQPFTARVRVRPPAVEETMEEDGNLRWRGERIDESLDEPSEKGVECVRNGTVRWRERRFLSEIDRRACRAPERPVPVMIRPDGRVQPRPKP